MRILERCGADFDGIELHRPSLDDVFLNKTGRSLRES
jgi:ABC-2 type transport system ATP-binding protein